MTTVKDTDTHHGKQVVSSVRVVIDTSKERRCRILADKLDDQMGTTRVLFNETANIMDETANENQWSLLCLFLDYAHTKRQTLNRRKQASKI